MIFQFMLTYSPPYFSPSELNDNHKNAANYKPSFSENPCQSFDGYERHRKLIHQQASSHPSGVRTYIKPFTSIPLPVGQGI